MFGARQKKGSRAPNLVRQGVHLASQRAAALARRTLCRLCPLPRCLQLLLFGVQLSLQRLALLQGRPRIGAACESGRESVAAWHARLTGAGNMLRGGTHWRAHPAHEPFAGSTLDQCAHCMLGHHHAQLPACPANQRPHILQHTLLLTSWCFKRSSASAASCLVCCRRSSLSTWCSWEACWAGGRQRRRLVKQPQRMRTEDSSKRSACQPGNPQCTPC